MTVKNKKLRGDGRCRFLNLNGYRCRRTAIPNKLHPEVYFCKHHYLQWCKNIAASKKNTTPVKAIPTIVKTPMKTMITPIKKITNQQ